jgi:hypothetical protein
MNKKVITLIAIAILVVCIGGIVFYYFSAPKLTVSFIKSTTDQAFTQGKALEYQFDVKVTVASSSNYPFGKDASTTVINNALKPLLNSYNLVNATYDGITTATWSNSYIANGESTFSLYSYESLNDSQIKSLTADLLTALSSTINVNQ